MKQLKYNFLVVRLATRREPAKYRAPRISLIVPINIKLPRCDCKPIPPYSLSIPTDVTSCNACASSVENMTKLLFDRFIYAYRRSLSRSRTSYSSVMCPGMWLLLLPFECFRVFLAALRSAFACFFSDLDTFGNSLPDPTRKRPGCQMARISKASIIGKQSRT